jgi:hypothetical protein
MHEAVVVVVMMMTVWPHVVWTSVVTRRWCFAIMSWTHKVWPDMPRELAHVRRASLALATMTSSLSHASPHTVGLGLDSVLEFTQRGRKHIAFLV